MSEAAIALPIDFRLEGALALGAARPTLAIVNTSDAPWTLLARDASAPAMLAYSHVTLHFRPGVVAAASQASLAAADSAWQVSGEALAKDRPSPIYAGGGFLIRLFPAASQIVLPGGALAVALPGLHFNPPDGARSTQVQLAYQCVRLGDSPAFDTRVHAFRFG